MLPDIDINPFETPNQNKQDENLFVRFYYQTVEDKKASIDSGMPKFKEREFVSIRVPGKKDEVCRPVSEVDRKRFPRHYEAFKNRTGDLEIEGTSLKEWTGITRSMAEEMSFHNILTVEMLANAPDVQLSKFLGGMTAKQKAIDWVEQMKSEKPFLEMKKENEEMRSMIKDLHEAVNNLKAEVTANAKSKKKAN